MGRKSPSGSRGEAPVGVLGDKVPPQKLKHFADIVYRFYRASSYASVLLAVVILSDCPTVARVLCDKTKQSTADILIPRERAITLVF